jgi:pimeloyl-ACP methyl ester carboxylesterase
LPALSGAPERWVLAGHSLGAVVASAIAADSLAKHSAEQSGNIAGLVLMGTSHPGDVDLSRLTVPVAKLAGTLDGLASPDEVKRNRPLLPEKPRWTWIDGGNHSQFGWYGFQPGDRWHVSTGEDSSR